MPEYHQLRDNQWLTSSGRTELGRLLYTNLLQGFQFSVCQTPEAFEAALDVRRRVYRGSCGYDVPVPDGYDHRSWLLLAENSASAEPVGTMRITPRTVGRLEAEEYFSLPPRLRSPRTVEMNRFAIVPGHDDLGLAEFLFDTDHPEIKLPVIQPGLGPTVETMGQSFLLAMSA